MHNNRADTLAGNLADHQPEVLFGETLADTEPGTLSSKFSPNPFPERGLKYAGGFKAILDKTKKNAAYLSEIFQNIISRLKAWHAFFREYFRVRERLERFLKWTTALAGAAVLIGFGINTLVHLVHIPTKETTIEVNKIKKEMPGRFTIQVAAYLKKTHADDYLAELRQKGLDPYIYRADGGGRTWFIVRISHFPDRKSAVQYGANLKDKGLIDDFFVDNNE